MLAYLISPEPESGCDGNNFVWLFTSHPFSVWERPLAVWQEETLPGRGFKTWLMSGQLLYIELSTLCGLSLMIICPTVFNPHWKCVQLAVSRMSLTHIGLARPEEWQQTHAHMQMPTSTTGTVMLVGMLCLCCVYVSYWKANIWKTKAILGQIVSVVGSLTESPMTINTHTFTQRHTHSNKHSVSGLDPDGWKIWLFLHSPPCSKIHSFCSIFVFLGAILIAHLLYNG